MKRFLYVIGMLAMSAVASAASIPAGYIWDRGSGHFVNLTDGTGPYLADPNGNIQIPSVAKQKDTAVGSTDLGSFTLGVRQDAVAAQASAAGNASQISVSKWGAIWTTDWKSYARTYAASGNVTVASSATDIAQICGITAGPIYLMKVRVSGSQTTAGGVDVLLIKRSTATSGGTSSTLTAVPFDSTDAAASATLKVWTANGTPGTAVGTVSRRTVPIGTATAPTSVSEWNFGERSKPVLLQSANQCLDVNLNGTTVTGGVFNIDFEWVEAP